MITISSCGVYTYATTQDDIYVETDDDIVHSNVAFDVIIQYGTPYYRDGVLLYYLYKDIYYYSFYYNKYWYVRAYRRPFTHFDIRPYFRPHRYDYRFSPGHYRGFDRPRNPNVQYRSIAPHHQNRGFNNRRPNSSRPDIKPRQVQPDRRTYSPRPNRSSITPQQRNFNMTRSQGTRNFGSHGGGRR